MIDMCALKRILFLVFVQWQGTNQMIATPFFDNNWSLSLKAHHNHHVQFVLIVFYYFLLKFHTYADHLL